MSGKWPDERLTALCGIKLPIIQAPMAGATTPRMAAEVSRAGGLGSLPCAMYSPDQARQAIGEFRLLAGYALNLNFFCHVPPAPDTEREAAWLERLAPYYAELGLRAPRTPLQGGRAPFDGSFCDVVEEMRPDIVSFHFGLPAASLLQRVRATGARIIASATTLQEALFLQAQGCDAIIAMGIEAGGHRGNFLNCDMSTQIGTQALGTMALVTQIVDVVSVPVIAAGGIADGHGMAAALMLGAAGVQIGTAFLLTPESCISAAHRSALKTAPAEASVLTNVFTGRSARGLINRLMRELGPLCPDAPAFPLAAAALAPLRAARPDEFGAMWAGQGFRLAREMDSVAVTCALADEAWQLVAGDEGKAGGTCRPPRPPVDYWA